jgi:uncharacterized coiled-coil protein SlyX
MIFANIAEWCARVRRALRGGYVRRLEDEVARQREEITHVHAEVARERAEIERLRVENRALLNSVLGTAGVPPIETPPMHPASVPAVRRRSWPQIATQREIEVAREARAAERARRA